MHCETLNDTGLALIPSHPLFFFISFVRRIQWCIIYFTRFPVLLLWQLKFIWYVENNIKLWKLFSNPALYRLNLCDFSFCFIFSFVSFLILNSYFFSADSLSSVSATPLVAGCCHMLQYSSAMRCVHHIKTSAHSAQGSKCTVLYSVLSLPRLPF